jgi:hypothetical protein
VFAGHDTVRDYRKAFLDAGAVAVISTGTELAESVTTITRRRFRAAVSRVVTAAGGHADPEGPAGWRVDAPAGQATRIEARDWRLRPTAIGVNRVWNRAEQLLAGGEVSRVFVVVPVDRVSTAQRERAPGGVEVLTLDQLRVRLGLDPAP